MEPRQVFIKPHSAQDFSARRVCLLFSELRSAFAMGRSCFLLTFMSIFYAFLSPTPVLGESVFSRRQGDVMFGALFPIRQKDEHGSCGQYRHESMTWISALNFALEEINSKKQHRYNVSFGVEVRDTCSDVEKALEQGLELVRMNNQGALVSQKHEQLDTEAMRASRPVLGVIWDSADEEVATLFDLFKVPHVSFTRCEDFTRWEDSNSKFSFTPVSIEYYQALAVADLVRYYAWSSVSLVYSHRNAASFRALQHVTRVDGICLATITELSHKKSWNASAVIKELQSESQNRVVILLTTPKHSAKLLKAAEESGDSQFTWIVMDGRSLCSLDNSFSSLDGSLALVSRAPIMEELQKDNSWFTEKVKSSFVSSGDLSMEAWKHVAPSARLCEMSHNWTNVLPWQRQAEAQAIVNSVYMFFHAFWKIVEVSCQEMAFAKYCQDKLDGSLLFKELNNGVNDIYTQRLQAFNLQPHLTENTFSLINIQKGRPNKLVTVGSWERSWAINHDLLRWKNESANSAPESSCGAPCEPGYIRVLKDSSQCCWSCASCNYKQYVKDNYTCADCVRGYWPSRDFRKCEFQWRRTLFDCLAALVAMVLVFSFLVL